MKNKLKTADYVFDTILIVCCLFLFSFWFSLFVSFTIDIGFGAGLFLIPSGVVVIIFGYWSKYWSRGFLGSPYFVESIEILREKIKLNEKISLNHRLELWMIDGYLMKICNKLGLLLIITGFVMIIIGLVVTL